MYQPMTQHNPPEETNGGCHPSKDRSTEELPDEVADEESTFSRWTLPSILLVLTVFTMLWAGAYQNHVDSFHPFAGAWRLLTDHPSELIEGIPFAATLLLILGTHELAHFFFSKHHGVPAALPLFIPGLPLLVGTFGAVIRLRGPILERKALFDIGISGPLAGLLIAFVALFLGLQWSQVETGTTNSSSIIIGPSLLVNWCVSFLFGELPAGSALNLHPIAEAAWFGIFVTCLNLLPIGQLDGGHVAYAMWGERQRFIAFGLLPVLLALGYFWHGWLLWAGLAGLIGFSHPPIPAPDSDLGRFRTWLGRAMVVLFFLIFPPIPLYL
jgi:membrane-associated protease RseP (regulator of RpoE activity)